MNPSERQAKAKEIIDTLPLPPSRYGTGILIPKSRNIDLTNAEESILIIQAPDSVEIENNPDQEQILSSIEPTDIVKAWHIYNSKIKLIKIPTTLSSPIIIKHNPQAPGATHIFIIAEPNVKATIIEEITGDPKLYTTGTEILAKENSEINHISIQSLGKESYYSNFQHAWVEKDAKIEWLRGNFGADYSRSDNMTDLEGENSNVKNWLVFISRNEQQQDISSGARHIGSQTTSDMVSRGIVKDQSKNIYRGKVRVEPGTKGIDGYQKHDVLILSDDAEADAIPELEIETDDVKCSHGATIGKINKDQLFYLMSRGLNKEQATKAIIEGFFEPLMKIIPESTKELVQKEVIQLI